MNYSETLGLSDEELIQRLKNQGYTEQEIELFKATKEAIKSKDRLKGAIDRLKEKGGNHISRGHN